MKIQFHRLGSRDFSICAATMLLMLLWAFPAHATRSEGTSRLVREAYIAQKIKGDYKKTYTLIVAAKLYNNGITDPIVVSQKVQQARNFADYIETTAAGQLYDPSAFMKFAIRLRDNLTSDVADLLPPGASALYKSALETLAEEVDGAARAKAQAQAIDDYNRFMNGSWKELSDNSADILKAAELNPAARDFFVNTLGGDPIRPVSDLGLENPALINLVIEQKVTQLQEDLKNGVAGTQERIDLLKSEIVAAVEAGLLEVNAENQELMETLGNRLEDSLGAGFSDIDNQFDALGAEVFTNKLFLEKLVQNQEEQAAREAEQQRLAVRAQQRANIVLGLQTTARFLALIDASPQTQKFVNDVAAVANTVATIADSLDQISSLTAQAGAAFLGGPMGVAAAFNIANASMALFSQFGSSGPSSDEVILQELAAIRQQLIDMQVQLNERFDRVDARLNDVILLMADGFDKVYRGQSVITTALRENVSISLNTQHLLLNEADRLAARVDGYFLVPCVNHRHQLQLPLEDQRFGLCVQQLKNHVLSNLVSDQTAALFNPIWTPVQLDQNLRVQEQSQKHATMLLDAVINATGNTLLQGFRPVLNPAQWTMATTWYRDFLLEDPAQTRRVLISGTYGLRSMADAGTNIINFKKALLGQLDVSRAAEPGTLLNWYLSAFPGVDASVISGLLGDAEVEYTNLNLPGGSLGPAPVYFDPLPLRKKFGEISIYAEDQQSLIAIPDGGTTQTGRTVNSTAEEAVVSKLPASTRRATLLSLGRLRLNVAYVSSTWQLTGQLCNPISGDNRPVWTVVSEKFRLTVYLENEWGLGLPNDPEIFLHDFNSKPAFGGRVCSLTTPSSTIGANSTLAERSNGLISSLSSVQPLAESLALSSALQEAWEAHRKAWALKARVGLGDAISSSDSPYYLGGQAAEKANALMSALIRFLLGDEADLSENVYMLGSGVLGIPTFGRMLDVIDTVNILPGGQPNPDVVAELEAFTDVEQAALRDYMLDPYGLQQHLQRAVSFDRLEPLILKLKTAEQLLGSNVTMPISEFGDPDNDGVISRLDNCMNVSNADQRDTDDDGYGNVCDADLNNDGRTNTLDLGIFRAAWQTDISLSSFNENADLNGDFVVNTLDLGRFRALWQKPPGPLYRDLIQ